MRVKRCEVIDFVPGHGPYTLVTADSEGAFPENGAVRIGGDEYQAVPFHSQPMRFDTFAISGAHGGLAGKTVEMPS